MDRLKVDYKFNSLDKKYGGFWFEFFWARRCKDVVIQTSNFYECRESFCYTARAFFNNQKKDNKSKTLIEELLLHKISVGVIVEREKTATNKLHNGRRVLNIVEKYYGWPLTKMCLLEKVDAPHIERGYDAAFFQGTARWLRSTHMISLFTLLIRLGRFDELNKCKTFPQLKKYIKEHSTSFGDGDMDMANLAFSITDILIGNYNNMFKGLTKEYLYSKNQYRNSDDTSGFAEGIFKLSLNGSNDKKLSNKLKKMCDKL